MTSIGKRLPTPQRGQSTRKSHANVLIIEDDPDTAEMVCTLLIKEGYGARVVSYRDEALLVLNQYLYDVIVMDLYMPGIGAEEFVTEVRKKHVRSTIILITAIDRVDMQAKKLGLCHFIGKPLHPDELLNTIRNCQY
jgi:DNA-binding response OmpR family regulator